MYQAERMGLETLGESGMLNTPKVLDCFYEPTGAYLIMEFIVSKVPEKMDMVRFGHALAELHRSAAVNYFGFETDNFIGSLYQRNAKYENWTEFYVRERLVPQLKLARDQTSLIQAVPTVEKMEKRCAELIGEVTTSLLHGDLWGGNYIISKSGQAYLIDPSVYFGHNEVDLAMSKLFGGFSIDFYNAYNEIIPKHPNQDKLTEIYQLYYLLVHLNLFGISYLSPVQRILKKYFA